MLPVEEEVPKEDDMFEAPKIKRPISEKQKAHLEKARKASQAAMHRRRQLEIKSNEEMQKEMEEPQQVNEVTSNEVTSIEVRSQVNEEEQHLESQEDDEVKQFEHWLKQMSRYKDFKDKNKKPPPEPPEPPPPPEPEPPPPEQPPEPEPPLLRPYMVSLHRKSKSPYVR